jgi:uncharacterized protein (DUF1697 family)
VTYVAFLRAVIVGGRGVLRMTDVVGACRAAGCRDVRTFQAAGNVIFEASPRRVAAVARRMQQQISALLGADAGVTVRSGDELRSIVRQAPFASLMPDRGLKLYVVLLLAPARRKPAYPFTNEKEALEAIGARATEVFVVSRRKPRGMMYGFPNAFVEHALGVPATSRNWSTVTRIVAGLAGGQGEGRSAKSVRSTSHFAMPPTRSDRAAGARRGGRAGSRSRAS